ncbi:thioredoxin family protein [Sphingosinicella microcystinivorans]|uniref:thioredoxin family protein n=1 Tax=Sphingosinicella microcystinivorans TaxID=335406 RepID=UPI0022F38A4E|nr:thioredoxin family protein [Sphingosinicella microcystinivorans]WBX83089.1 thioredoxin family protein [Sphingosinicella microcystinivorans]
MRTAIAAFAAIAFAGTAALAAPEVGKTAPAFTAQTAAGKTVSLKDFAGKTVVLEWTNSGCPFVKKHYESGNMQKLQADAKANGVVWLTVNSSAPGKQGHVDSALAAKEMKDWTFQPTAYLLDHDGKVGKAYDARATPHMYVIDGKGVLRYAGAIDDKPTANPADIKGAKNYVTAALGDISAGRAVASPVTRAYGCTVKYPDA